MYYNFSIMPKQRWNTIWRSPEGRAFNNARSRCRLAPLYRNRIKFKFKSFGEFLKCLGPKPSSKHMLDRINNDGHYEPGNVRWATTHEQMLNRRMTRTRYLAICKNLIAARQNSVRDPVTGRYR